MLRLLCTQEVKHMPKGPKNLDCSLPAVHTWYQVVLLGAFMVALHWCGFSSPVDGFLVLFISPYDVRFHHFILLNSSSDGTIVVLPGMYTGNKLKEGGSCARSVYGFRYRK